MLLLPSLQQTLISVLLSATAEKVSREGRHLTRTHQTPSRCIALDGSGQIGASPNLDFATNPLTRRYIHLPSLLASSDVLSRHKRQCRVVLQLDGSGEGEKPAEGESAPKATKPRRSSSAAKPGRPKGSTKAAKAAAAVAANNGNADSNGADTNATATASSLGADAADGPAPPPPAPHSDQLTHDAIAVAAAAAAAAAAAGHHPVGNQAQDEDASAMIDPAIAADSQAQAAAAATTVAAISSVAAYQYANSMDPPDFHMGRGALNPYASTPFPLPVHSAVAALHPQLYQPSSPESNQPRSEHGSPRYGGQPLARHGSNSSSRFSRPAHNPYDPYAARQSSTFANPADAAIWEGLDTAKLPSPGHGAATTPGSAARATVNMLASLGFPVTSPLSHLADRSRTGSHLGSDASYFRSTAPGLSGGVGAGSSSNLAGYGSSSANSPAFSFGTSTSSADTGASSSNHSTSNATAATSTSQGQEASGATTPKEPVRFSVSTLGPLSPFSNTALNSSMSPYLSAFSNARDTPLVSSPRSQFPTTPGGGLASLDLGGQWTGMRPPSRSVSRHNSLQGINVSSQSTSPQTEGVAVSSKPGKHPLGDKPSLSDRAEAADSNDSRTVTTSSASTSASATSSAVTTAVDGPATSSASATSAAAAPSTTATATTSGAGTVTTSAPVQMSSSGIDTPSRFVKNQSQQYFDGGALTPGPEAFLLRLQGGVQELRAGIHGSEISFFNGPAMALSSATLGASQFSTPNWDHSMFSNPSAGSVAAAAASSGTPGAQLSALGWLMSPSIQQLLNAFSTTAGSGTVDTTNTSDYFNSKIVSAPERVDLDSMTVGIAPSPLEKALSDVRNPFFIPPDMFRPCYAIEHWNLPPITRLSVLALHAQQNLLKHFPVVHEPTFRMDTTPGCIAFALCMLGGHEAGRKWWAGEEVVPKSAINIINSHGAPPEADNLLLRATDSGPSRYVDEEDGQELVKPVVMSEKTDALMRAFASRCKSVRDKCAVVQALMLYQCNNFLSSDATTRMVAGVSHGTVVTMARQAGFFDPDAEHAQRTMPSAQDVMQQVLFETVDTFFSYSFMPTYGDEKQDGEQVWRRWAELEGRRRCAFVIYTMDTVAHLDAAVPTLLATKEVAHLPLPSPDYIWRAPTSTSWHTALAKHRALTLDEALQQLLSSEPGNSPPSEVPGEPSLNGAHGPFARLVMVLALLRGIIEMLEGRAMRVAKPSSLHRWMKRCGAHSNGTTTANDAQVGLYKKALARWRKAWDQDPTCRFASAKKPKEGDEMDTSEDLVDGKVNWVASAAAGKHDWPEELQRTLFTPLTASGATPLSNDALPLYWLAHVLVTHAASNQRLPLRSVEGRMGAASKNGGYAVMSGGPEMPDFRAMLRFAKNFVTRGEK